MKGRTIRIYLVDGEPTGILTAEIINWTGKVIVTPRAQLAELAKREEARRTGVYFLVGPDPDSPGKDRVYIGEGDNVLSRLTSHDNDESKDFWTRAAFVISKDQNLTKAHGRFLESRLIQMVQQAGRATLANGTAPAEPPLPEPDVADMEYFLGQVQMIFPVLSFGKGYTGLMIGSSNFTQAGMGIGTYRNAEANVLTIAEHLPQARDPRRLKEVWPDMERVEDPTTVEWQGPTPEMVEEQRANNIPVPAGFVSATYRAGDRRSVLLRLDPDHLPVDWSIHGTGRDGVTLLTSESWQQQGRREPMTLTWEPLLPPEKLLVRWTSRDGQRLEAFLPLNVEDAKQLPPPAELAEMSADDMLLILAASDPSAAFRVWAKKRAKQDIFDENLDTALPPDLDPLRRYELKATFLRRVRSRARVLAQLRQNLQRPVWGVQALQWRLEGFIGIRPLAQRLLCEVLQSDGSVDEALLTLADLVILLREVEYEPVDGALPKRDFIKIYEPFLGRLVDELNGQVHSHRARVGRDLLSFWDRVVERCRN